MTYGWPTIAASVISSDSRGTRSTSPAEFDARVRQIGGHQWQAPTPDEDWTVRDLVNHLVGEDLWAPLLLAGSTITEVGDRFDGDVLGPEPRAAWAAACAAVVQAIEADGAMDRIVHLSFGDFPGREYALQLIADHLIRAWDLARAIGADERLDTGLIAWRNRSADIRWASARPRRGPRRPGRGPTLVWPIWVQQGSCVASGFAAASATGSCGRSPQRPPGNCVTSLRSWPGQPDDAMAAGA